MSDDRVTPLAIAISGATGATGSIVVDRVAQSERFVLRGALAAPREVHVGTEIAPGVTVTDDPAVALHGADVLVDFSAPAAVEALLPALMNRPIPAVFGTTALPATVNERIDELARVTPVVVAPNMSFGISLLRRLVRDAATLVDRSWDVEIVELHHRRKVDAPSGTALALGADVAAITGGEIELGRQGDHGPRRDGIIGIQAVRGGDVVGEHSVLLFGDGERLELVHRASDRATFATGALRAARWLTMPGRTPGRYSMDDVLADRDRAS